MSIYTTQYITRECAIDRIEQIAELVIAKRYRDIEEVSCEHEHDVAEFVHDGIDFNISDVKNWSNKMLDRRMDCPFYRFSTFDNYLISE